MSPYELDHANHADEKARAEAVATPRLDALAASERHNTRAETMYWCKQFYSFAGTIERELTAATKELAECRAERDAAVKDAERWRDATREEDR